MGMMRKEEKEEKEEEKTEDRAERSAQLGGLGPRLVTAQSQHIHSKVTAQSQSQHDEKRRVPSRVEHTRPWHMDGQIRLHIDGRIARVETGRGRWKSTPQKNPKKTKVEEYPRSGRRCRPWLSRAWRRQGGPGT